MGKPLEREKEKSDTCEQDVQEKQQQGGSQCQKQQDRGGGSGAVWESAELSPVVFYDDALQCDLCLHFNRSA